MNQGSGNEEILNTARDYFYFATKFFEPISVSATHIYHSALELSPLSSIVRRLYYQRRHTSSPRVIVGNQDSWDQQLVISCKYDHNLCAWSPCGRFIAAGNKGWDGVEIRDSLSFELLSTLIPTRSNRGGIGHFSLGQLGYSMDGRSIASTFGTLLIIWDIQTGGVTEEIHCFGVRVVALVWSLNGSTIGIISESMTPNHYLVSIYNTAPGTKHCLGTLPSASKPYIWAYDTSFRVMTTARDNEGLIIDVFEVGPVLTEIESFRIGSLRGRLRVESFSQSTYRISISVGRGHFVFDVRTSRCLLNAKHTGFHCFSSDGSLSVDVSGHAVRIWKYTSNGYTPWREFPFQFQPSSFLRHSLQLSPTSSLLLARCGTILRLWRLDGPPIVAHPGRRIPLLITLSRCGSYIAAGPRGGSIVTITNLVSQTPPHSIDAGMSIDGLALTGNVLLVWYSGTIAAWRLTEDGSVDGVSIDRRAGRGDSIWTLSLSDEPIFSFGDQTVAIRQNGEVTRVYCTETGEVLEPTQALLHHRHYFSRDVLRGLHYLHYRSIDPDSIMYRGWMKDPEGKHRLWIPVEWRDSLDEATSSDDRKTLRLDLAEGETILVKF